MMAAEKTMHLIERLPSVRGRLRADEPLARYTWFRVGGPAEVLFEPDDADDLIDFLAAKPGDVPVTVIGGTSNIMIRDGGIPGVTVRLGKGFSDIAVDGMRLEAGAAAADIHVAKKAEDAGLAGLEFRVGIPGTVGGALRMNAGAYGSEISAVFEAAKAVDLTGTVKDLSWSDMGFDYRHSDIPTDWIFISAVFKGELGDKHAIHARMTEIQEKREATQPVRERTGGSTFANPEGHSAWKLIDEAGCRGLRLGGAQVSEAHTNFRINTGDATAADLESLGEEVRRRVKDMTGIELRWEIRRLGIPARTGPSEVTP